MTFEAKGSLPTDLGHRIRSGINEAAHMIGNELVRRARAEILTGTKTGRSYPGLPNQSSAPGEYSANQTGDLLNSIEWRMSGSDYLSFYATSPHAGFQEYGTVKMDPRPNLKMAIDESDGLIRELLEQIVFRAMGG